MDGLMLVLEIVVVLLLAAEVYIRLRARRKRAKEDEPASPSKSSAPQSAPPSAPVPPRADSVAAVSSSQGTAEGMEEASLSADDLLKESAIYMQYGHYSQAATVLRWYVDLRPDDTRAINQLLDAYLALEDLDAYTELLASLGEKLGVQSPTWWRGKIHEGLKRDPGNLELLVLAEKLGIPIPTPGEGVEEPMTAAKALALVSRNPDPKYAISVLHAAILEEPLRLPLYAELLRITHRQHDLEGFIDGLILLFLALGDTMRTLRERMLKAGLNLGPHPLWQTLEEWDGDRAKLRELAAARKLHISPKLPH